MISRITHTNGEHTAASKTYRECLYSKPSCIYAVNQQVALDCQDAADPDRLYFWDELPTVFETFTFNSLPLSHEFVSGRLVSSLADEPSYFEVVANEHIRNIAKNGWKDDVLKDSSKLIKVASRIVSDDYGVFVNAKQFLAFKNGLPRQLQFFVVARPSLFPTNTTFIGANFFHSLAYQIWSASEDVTFVPHPQIKAKRSDLSHMADQTSIYYLSERNFSKTLFDQKIERSKGATKPTAFSKIAKATGKLISRRFPNEKFIYCSNKEHERLKWAGENGQLVSSNSRGWNGGRGFNMCVYLAAINYDPASVTFLHKMYGINREQARQALTVESAYQFAGRTGLRKDSTDQPITLIFGDRSTANAIRDMIPGCAAPQLLDLGIPELLYPDDEEEEDCEPVEKKPLRTEEELRIANNIDSRFRNRRNKIKVNHSATPQYDGFMLRFWGHYSSQETVESEALEWEDVLGFLRDYVTENHVDAKERNFMFREGVFFDIDNHRLKDNIMSSKLVVLDLDNVKGEVQELSDYLKSRKVSNAIVSTYSCVNVGSMSQRDIRVRVLVPLDEAVDAEHYSRIVRLLRQDIATKFADQFVIDPACMSINNRFYAPCVPAKGEPIFINGTYYDFDIHRPMSKKPIFLNAIWYMCRNLPEDLEPPVVKRHIKGSVRKAAEEIVMECAAMASSGNGDKTFYYAAVELIKAGYSKEEAIAALQGREHMFGSGKGRDAERAVSHVIGRQRPIATASQASSMG
jgi:hypothetical protein